jgi:hypothetical protein
MEFDRGGNLQLALASAPAVGRRVVLGAVGELRLVHLD